MLSVNSAHAKLLSEIAILKVIYTSIHFENAHSMPLFKTSQIRYRKFSEIFARKYLALSEL